MRPVTKKTIEWDLRNIDEEIRKHQEAIQKLEADKTEKENLLQDLEVSISLNLVEGNFYVFLPKYTSTIKLMDAFEALTIQGFRLYKTMILNPGYSYYDLGYFISLIIERYDYAYEYQCEFTMSQIKRKQAKRLFDCIKKDFASKDIGDDDIGSLIYLEEPIMLRAQTSNNRTGYGSIYNGENLIHEGTLYGETTSYIIKGVRLSGKM